VYHASYDTHTYSLSPKKTKPYQTLPQPDTTYAQGQPQNVPDTRFPANLPNGPYQITINDGHPASSSLSLFEASSSSIVNEVISKPDVFKSTAVFITFDEGGGYYDSGYIQPLAFFGDGPRVPLLVVSPYTRQGYVDHTYYDHVSILKFIEENWHLQPLSKRSLDNLPNPKLNDDNPYKPTNGLTIGDLMRLFDFGHQRTDTTLLPY